MDKLKSTPECSLSAHEKALILDKSYLSKSDFLNLIDLPKKQALIIFNKVKNELKEKYGNGSYQLVNSNYLPTQEVLKRVVALKRFTKEELL